MHLSFTKLKLYVLLFLIVICSNSLVAQFGAPITIHGPFGSTTVPGQGMAFNYFFYGNKIPSNGKYDYQIVLLNDSIISTKKTWLDIDFNKNHTNISWSEGKGKERKIHTVTPKETKEIYRMVLGEYKLTGISLDSTWAFMIDKGKIRTYSITSDFREPTIAYFQYGEKGSIFHLTKDNLLPLIEDDPEILKLVNKNDLIRAIKKYNEKFAKQAILFPKETPSN